MRLVENPASKGARGSYRRPVSLDFEPLGLSAASKAKWERAAPAFFDNLKTFKSFSSFPLRHDDLVKLKLDLERPVAYFLFQDEQDATFHFTQNRTHVREFVKKAKGFVAAYEAVPRPTLVEVSSRFPFSTAHQTLAELERSIQLLQAYITAGQKFAAESIPSGQTPRLPYIRKTIIMLADIYEQWSGEKFNPNRATAKGYLRREYVSSGPLFVQLFFLSLEADVTVPNINSVLANVKKTAQEFHPESEPNS